MYCYRLHLLKSCFKVLAHVAERKLAEMKSAMHVVDDEVGVLKQQQAELLCQLSAIQQQIAAAKAKRVSCVAPCHQTAVVMLQATLLLVCLCSLHQVIVKLETAQGAQTLPKHHALQALC